MTLKQVKNHIKVFKLYYVKAPSILFGLAFFTISTVIVALSYNLYAGKIIDYALEIASKNGNFSQIVVPLTIFILLLVGMSISENLRNYFEVVYYNAIYLIIDDYEYKKNISLDLQTYVSPAFVNKKNMLENNGFKIATSPKNMIEFIGTLTPAILYTVVLCSFSTKIGILVILSIIPAVIIIAKSGKKIWGIWEDNSSIREKWNMYRNALWGDITDIKVLGAGHHIISKMLFFYREFLQKISKNERQKLFNTFGAMIIEYGLLAGAYVILVQGIIGNEFSIGSFFIITAALWGVKRELGNTFEKLAIITADANFIDDFIEYMELEPKIISKADAVEIKKSEPVSIEFKNVWFRYPRSKKWVFKGLNFKITKDEDVALVGKNGAGKTTMMKLITRMYDPNKGQILVNDIPLTDINLEEYYKMIGILNQDFRIFEFSAKENIQIGDIKKKGSLVAIKNSAVLAQADSFISDLKNGYETFLTTKVEDGQEISGGQRQRVAIARIFYREPKLLILDEPTSAIDALAEEEIFNSIFEYAENRTVIIISHRFATIKRAHRIIVIDNGMIIEDGTHTQLLAQNGLYKRMYSAQE